ncbi:MFS transporter [Nocardioides sp. NPDC051685]|uniref:MFS transporter n=1 Tax=Nocardioides sp. NPDC051685 TaxID=3364334 RepID=UPI0037876D7B
MAENVELPSPAWRDQAIATPADNPAKARRIALTAGLAASIEWYDFFIYGTAAALVFGPMFFPSANPVAGILVAFATFGVGFVVRPIGGILFGHFGDKFGRKPMLVVAMIMMPAATTLIGLLPTYSSIGIAAPVLLVLFRICQGLAVGGQWGGAMLMATENAPEGKRGLYGSFVQVGVPVGLVAGNAVFLVIARVVSPEQFMSWGWRVPFLLSAVFLLLALHIHFRIEDTPEFRQAEAKLATLSQRRRRSPVIDVLRRHPRQVLTATGALLGGNAALYVLVTGTLDYATRTLGIPKDKMLIAVFATMSTAIVLIPLFAYLSDRIGRRRVCAAGSIVMGVWPFAVFPLVETTNLVWIVLALEVAIIAISAGYGPLAALFAELFPAHLRYSGVSFAYQFASVFGGGVAPFIMVLLLESTGSSVAVSAYLSVLSVIALVSLALMRFTPVERSAPR